MEDAITAYVRAIEAHESISGIFNIASGNYTVGEVGDLVKAEIEQQLGVKIKLVIRHMQDFRNYKVSFEKAKNVLSFHPQHDIRAIVSQLVKEMNKFSDWENPRVLQHSDVPRSGKWDQELRARRYGRSGAMRVAVIGANGQLGSDIVAELQSDGDEVVGFTHAEIDIASLESTRNALAVRPRRRHRQHSRDAPRGELREGSTSRV